jgi:hypothetical protein
MELFKNDISQETTNKINDFIDKNYPYQDSLWVFPNLNPEFFNFFREQCPDFADKYITDDCYIVLRLVKPGCLERAYEFHFDQYQKTVVVPLMKGESTMNGDLLIQENARKTPSNIWIQLVQKALYQCSPMRAFFKRCASKHRRFTRVDIPVGHSAIFNGITSLHGNLPVLDSERRTILIHSEKLFEHSPITRYIESFSQFAVLKKK